MAQSALLVLEDGSCFKGESIGVSGTAVGEVVFNTSMTGYQEILTDPSYARQMVTLTYPHIGNTGTTPEDNESKSVFAAGFIVRDVPVRLSNWRSTDSLGDYLKKNKVIGIAGIDTRRLTRILREKGALSGCIMAGGDGTRVNQKAALAAAKAFPGLKGLDLAKEVTTRKVYDWNEGEWVLGEGYNKQPETRFNIVAYDFGVKRNILRMLSQRGCKVTVVPAKTSATDVLAMKPDGIFLSNGPGDPEPCEYAINAIREILEANIPVFGICLGHQLLGLASGARTMKMKFGHHGANHPVQDLASGQVLITSQNHGFAIDDTSLPGNLEITHKSLFDGSVQGIRRTDRPAYSFQGHPEASPGPHDVAPLFDQFISMMEEKS